MAQIFAIGEPVNESERKVVEYLGENLPDDYLIFHNIEIPDGNKRKYECDLIIAGKFLIYAVDIKNYVGSIRGTATEWELTYGDHVRVIKNPLPKARMVGKVTKTYLDKQFKHEFDVKAPFVHPLVILANEDCEIAGLPSGDWQSVLHLHEVLTYMQDAKRVPFKKSYVMTDRKKQQLRQIIQKNYGKLQREQVHIQDYLVLDNLHQTNAYTTFHAQHQILREPFQLRLHTNDTIAWDEDRDFQSAIKSLTQMGNHANIASVYPPFYWDRQLVIPSEWVGAKTVRDMLEDDGAINFAEALDIILGITRALYHSHTHDILHGNVVPENIFIPNPNEGILGNFDLTLTETASQSVYLAPELDEGMVTMAGDQYALGIVFCEMLLGELPDEITQDVLSQSLKKHLSVPDMAHRIIRWMVSPKPEKRYSDYNVLIHDLEKCATLANRLIGRVLNRKYRITELIHDNSCTVIFAGHDRALKHPIAIKVLRPECKQEEEISTFIKQIRRTVAIQHPRVISVYTLDYAKIGQERIAYAVMQLLEPQSLADCIDEPMSFFTQVARDVNEILHNLHEQGIYHLNIKPHNILFDANGNVILGELGTTTLILHREGQIVAPEQFAEDHEPHPTIDVYQWARTLQQTMQHLDISPELHSVFTTATHSSPQYRYASIADFTAAFLRAVEEAHDDDNEDDQANAAESTNGHQPKRLPLAVKQPEFEDDPIDADSVEEIAGIAEQRGIAADSLLEFLGIQSDDPDSEPS